LKKRSGSAFTEDAGQKKGNPEQPVIITRKKSDDLFLFHFPDFTGYFMYILLEPVLPLFCIIPFSLIEHLEEADCVHGSECF